MQKLQFTAIIQKGENGYFVGQVAEVPEAISQGHTMVELEANLLDALLLVWESNRINANIRYAGQKTILYKFEISSTLPK
jgi:predicted RNase H-like HicB family nuclease